MNKIKKQKITYIFAFINLASFINSLYSTPTFSLGLHTVQTIRRDYPRLWDHLRLDVVVYTVVIAILGVLLVIERMSICKFPFQDL